MAENIDGRDMLGSGGHVWHWASAQISAKTLSSAGIDGEGRMVLGRRACPCTIEGRSGGWAILKAADNASLNALEAALLEYKRTGQVCIWEDDQGRSGASIVIVDYTRGQRTYSAGAVWQEYRLQLLELDGGPG